jgi:hypothetical protein
MRDMSRHMGVKAISTPKLRTSLRLNASRLIESKTEAAKRGMTLTEFVNWGLYLAVRESQRPKSKEPFVLPVCKAIDGRGEPLIPINFNNSVEMWDTLDELERQEKLEREKARDDSSGR